MSSMMLSFVSGKFGFELSTLLRGERKSGGLSLSFISFFFFFFFFFLYRSLQIVSRKNFLEP
jgi:hypothetical protein